MINWSYNLKLDPNSRFGKFWIYSLGLTLFIVILNSLDGNRSESLGFYYNILVNQKVEKVKDIMMYKNGKWAKVDSSQFCLLMKGRPKYNKGPPTGIIFCYQKLKFKGLIDGKAINILFFKNYKTQKSTAIGLEFEKNYFYNTMFNLCTIAKFCEIDEILFLDFERLEELAHS